MLVVNEVSKFYRKKLVVKAISFSMNQGDRIAVLGPNGAGKTTLLEMLATVLKPDEGVIQYNNLTNEQEMRKKVGYVPQDLALFTNITVREQLKFWAQMSPKAVPNAKITELVTLVGLTEKLNEKTEHLSGGMKRKLNIILSLLHDPDLIILDEPTVGIDIQSKLEIIEFMKKICDSGKLLFFSSHDLQEIEQLCNKIVYLEEGRIVFSGTLTEARAAAKQIGSTSFATMMKYLLE